MKKKKRGLLHLKINKKSGYDYEDYDIEEEEDYWDIEDDIKSLSFLSKGIKALTGTKNW